MQNEPQLIGTRCGQALSKLSVQSRLSSAFFLPMLLIETGCQQLQIAERPAEALPARPIVKSLPDAPIQLQQLVDGGVAQAGITTGYDPSYVKIDYPGGDVPVETGVCSDVIVRAFRKTGIDLQKEIHEDMKVARSAYSTRWGTAVDPNIDHRRVLNLMTYFERKGKSLPITSQKSDYFPGDIVAWDLGGGIDHIGIVTNRWIDSEKRYLIVHNLGAGARIEDVLFGWKITGHYRYF